MRGLYFQTLIFVFILSVCLGMTSPGYCQNKQAMVQEIMSVYTGGSQPNGLIAGFSTWGLIGALLFSSLGFIAFMYGKNNSEFRPMLTGIVLMAYPYLIRSTVLLYIIGIGLCAILYYWRE